MQNEIIYIPNVKVVLLEELNNYFNINLSGKIIKINNLEIIGKPFNFITNQTFNDTHSFHYQPKKIFKEFMNPNLLTSSLNYYLNEAGAQFTSAKKESKEIQYLGLMHGKPINFHCKTKVEGSLEWETKRCFIPCHFCLIKDEI